jgi:hypothetical protein
MTQKNRPITPKEGTDGVAAFLDKVARTPAPASDGGTGRLIFAMDATMSRQPTWDRAIHIQSEMFAATDDIGGLAMQLVFFRGFGECKASRWMSSAEPLARAMQKVHCMGGFTQIERVLKHAIKEARKRKIAALVYVGDACEEAIDPLCGLAGELGLLGVKAFMFQEGANAFTHQAYESIAQLTGGAYCRFDASSAQQLRDLLKAVAVYAAGGRKALESYGRSAGSGIAGLIEQLR